MTLQEKYDQKISEHENYKAEYDKLRSICLSIYYARIAMKQDDVIKGLEKLDSYFREPNMN